MRFQRPIGGTLHLSHSKAVFLGGGKGLVNAYYRHAERLGVTVAYEASVIGLKMDGNHFVAAQVAHAGQTFEVRAKALVAAAGGFEANIPWLRESWGDKADNFIVRGTPYNTGELLHELLQAGAKQVSNPQQCHAVAIDGRAPRFDGGIVTRVDCVAFGLVVNRDGERFYDEGEDFWPKRYAIWGQLVADQPNQVAHVLIDSKAIGHFMPPVFSPIEGNTLGEIADGLEMDRGQLKHTVAAFN